jgi:lipopolysaccharide transport system ATP-binding protein
MSDTVIQVDNLWKKYRLGVLSTGTLRHDFNRWWHRVRGKPDRYTKVGQIQSSEVVSGISVTDDEMWALRGVYLEVKRGEIIGIIGRNGAGKSTFLKILSRVTAPTQGEVRVKGRIASLLEVGTGFHPELTGRENIFLNGAVLGMSREEIKRKFDEIVTFAEIQKFLDTPVKRYSSGMYVRLAFAVAAHLEPEIMIVDEVLAVGDAAFQKKCLGKMRDVASTGRTVLFVSHDIQAISKLTTRCVLLLNGSCIMNGLTAEVVDAYLQQGASRTLTYTDEPSSIRPNLIYAEIRTTHKGNVQKHGEAIQFVFQIATPIPIKRACFSFQVVSTRGQPMLHLWTFDVERKMCRQPGVYTLICDIPSLRLYMGRYTLSTYLSQNSLGETFQRLEQICPFEVVMPDQRPEWPWHESTAAYLEECEWAIEQIQHGASNAQIISP